ncbi:hypothetical protein ACP4OV_013378 [Aristida adscensionis]
MAQPPCVGATCFRFMPGEVAEMEAVMEKLNGTTPSRFFLESLARKFTASRQAAGVGGEVLPKQVKNWFNNRKYGRTKKTQHGAGSSSIARPSATAYAGSSSGINPTKASPMFEAKSKDGAWYDVDEFLSHSLSESGGRQVQVRLFRFGEAKDDWVDLGNCVRQRSVPCGSIECALVVRGDPVLCFKEGKEEFLNFDARVIEVQRQRHDSRGCRCRFHVRYEHDESEEIIPLRKLRCRPEIKYQRLKTSPAAMGTKKIA